MKLSIFGLLVFALLAFSSCTQEGLDLAEPEGNEVRDPVLGDDPAGNDDDREKCFDFVYPVKFTMPDGSTFIVKDEDGWHALRDWYKDHPDARKEPVLQFPVGVVFKGETMRVQNEDEMKRIREACEKERDDKWDRGDRDKRPCFKFIYPLTLIFPDGTEVKGDRDKLAAAKKRWYTAHPDSKARPKVKYPVGVIFKGETIRIKNEGEMRRLKEACKDWDRDRDRDWHKRPCFRFVYPITYVMPNGDKITGDNRKELWEAIKKWYEDHPDVAARPTLMYSVDVIFRGDTITINDENEMRRLKAACARKGDGGRKCPDLRGNVGDRCKTDDGRVGIINRDCECVPRGNRDYDCPDIRKNFGDRCRTAAREIGKINEDCECEIRGGGDFDCEDIRKNVGDPCKTADGKPGKINEDCECETRGGGDFDCEDIRKNVGDPCKTADGKPGKINEDCECETRGGGDFDCEDIRKNVGDPCKTADGKPGKINEDCECETRGGGDFDCEDIRKNVGDPCKTDDGKPGKVNEDCECEANGGGDFDCPDIRKNVGDPCRTATGQIGKVNEDCECEF